MTNAESRQKISNVNNNSGKKVSTSATNTSVQPASAKATEAAAQVTKVAATVAAAPTRDLNSAGKNTSTKPFALTDVTTWSVERARQIRKSDFERFVKFHNFFTASEDAVARPINNRTNAKREQVDHWVRGAVNPKVLVCIQEVQETQQALLSLIIVSAALTKYGEDELARCDKLGEMDSIISARFGTNALCLKQKMPYTVGASFVLRLVLGLAPEKRASCQTLCDILSHRSSRRLRLTPTTKGPTPVFSTASTDPDDWDNLNQCKLKHMIKQAQSAKFQEAMQQLGGEYLYDTIRTQLKQAGGATLWDANKDKPALQAKNLRPRPSSADKNPKQQKQQPAMMNGTQKQVQAALNHFPVEAEKMVRGPPPAPVSVKSATTVQVKKDTIPKTKAQDKNATTVKSVTFVKNVAATGAWVEPLPASILQSRPGAIVSITPTTSSRVGSVGRAVLSRTR